MSAPAPFEKNIEAYEAMRETLEEHHLYKFVVFHDAEFIDSFDSLDDAAGEAVYRFGQGPYLIRQVNGARRSAMQEHGRSPRRRTGQVQRQRIRAAPGASQGHAGRETNESQRTEGGVGGRPPPAARRHHRGRTLRDRRDAGPPGGGGLRTAARGRALHGHAQRRLRSRRRGAARLAHRRCWRLTSAVPDNSGFERSLDALRREAAGGATPPDHGVMLRGGMRW